jgi:hypothetical protein
MFMYPLPPVRATVQPRLSQRPGGQPQSEWGRVLSLLRQRPKVE